MQNNMQQEGFPNMGSRDYSQHQQQYNSIGNNRGNFQGVPANHMSTFQEPSSQQRQQNRGNRSRLYRAFGLNGPGEPRPPPPPPNSRPNNGAYYQPAMVMDPSFELPAGADEPDNSRFGTTMQQYSHRFGQNAPRGQQSTTQEYMLSEIDQSRFNNTSNIAAQQRRGVMQADDDEADILAGRRSVRPQGIAGTVPVNQDDESESGGRQRRDGEQQIAISEEHAVMYQRFSYKVSTWEALNFLLMIFELSFLAVASFILVYLRGRQTQLNISSDRLPSYSIFIITTSYPAIKMVWLGFIYLRAKREELNIDRRFEPVQGKGFIRDIITYTFIFIASMLFLGGCFLQYLQPTGSIVLLFSFAQRFLSLKRADLSFLNCRINMISVLRTLYNINILLTLVIVCICTFKSENLMLKETSWEQLLAPLYFFMTELLLIAIVSFVVLVNSIIQLCCNQSSRASRLARNYNNTNSQEMRVSVWFLYVAVCGLLCLFLLLKNASSLKNTSSTLTEEPTVGNKRILANYDFAAPTTSKNKEDSVDPKTADADPEESYNILSDKGQLVILYFGGIIVLTLIFFTSLRQWMANFQVQADELNMQKLFLENLNHPSTQQIIERIRQGIAEQERLEEEERRRRIAQANGQISDSGDGDEEEEEDQEELEQIKAIERMLDDPELQPERVPRYFFKISNSYFMSAARYYHQDLQKRNINGSKDHLNSKKNQDEVIGEGGDPVINGDITGISPQKKNAESKKDLSYLGEDPTFAPTNFCGPLLPMGKTPARHMNTCNDDELIYCHNQEEGGTDNFMAGELFTTRAIQKQRVANSQRQNKKAPSFQESEEKLHELKATAANKEESRCQVANQDCMICLSYPSDSVISPCGHGGICFECCQRIISEVVKSALQAESRTIPFYIVGNQGARIYNFRCHLCRNIGLRVFQLAEMQSTNCSTPGNQEPNIKKQTSKVKKQQSPLKANVIQNKYKSLTALKHATHLLRRQQLKNQVIKVKQYIDLRGEPPFLPKPIIEKPKQNKSKSKIGFQPIGAIVTYNTEEELKESLPNEFGTQRQDEPGEMTKYAFFDDEADNTNFNILRQKPDKNTQNNAAPSLSPRLPTDFEFDDNLATHKLSQLNFKRPTSANKNTAEDKNLSNLQAGPIDGHNGIATQGLPTLKNMIQTKNRVNKSIPSIEVSNEFKEESSSDESDSDRTPSPETPEAKFEFKKEFASPAAVAEGVIGGHTANKVEVAAKNKKSETPANAGQHHDTPCSPSQAKAISASFHLDEIDIELEGYHSSQRTIKEQIGALEKPRTRHHTAQGEGDHDNSRFYGSVKPGGAREETGMRIKTIESAAPKQK